MAVDLGVDRYGRPSSYTQTSPYTQGQRNNPAAQQPDYAYQQPQQQTNGSSSQVYTQDMVWDPAQGKYVNRQQQAQSQQQQPAPQPAQTFQQGQYFGQMEGFDHNKMRDMSVTDPKYQIARILQNYAPTREGLAAAIPELNALGLGTFEQFGRLGDLLRVVNPTDPRFQGVTEWDVVRAMNDQGIGEAWQFGDLGGGGGSEPAFAQITASGPAPTVGGGGGFQMPDTSHIGPLPTYTPYQFQQRDIPVYQPGQIDQFAAPDFSQFDSGQDALIQKILANPESMGADTVNQMRASQSEASARMLQDALSRMRQSAVSRGAIGGIDAGERRLNEAAMADLLGSFRDIDIAAAQTNFNDRLNALTGIEGVLGSRLGRAVQGYGATLQGQMAREEAQRAAIQSALDAAQFDFQRELTQADENRFGFTSEADKVRFELQKALGIGGLSLQERGLGLEGQRLAEMIRQFDLGRQDRRYEFDAGMNFNWGQLGANQQALLIQSLLNR